MRAPKLVFFALLLMVTVVLAQSQQPAAKQTGVLRLRVRVKADDAAPLRGLARKRFFLIPGTIEQNRALIDAIERQTLHEPRLLLPEDWRESGVNQLVERQVIVSRFTVVVSSRISSVDQRRCLSLPLLSPRARKSLATMKRRDSG